MILSIYFYDFVRNAFLIGIILAFISGLLSNFLVLRNQALIGDGLSHISFTGLTLGLLFFEQPFYIAIPFTILGAIIIKKISLNKKINGDAAIGIISSISLALGLIIIRLSNGFNSSIEDLLVGNIFTNVTSNIYFSLIILIITLLFIIIFYKKLLLMTFDYEYAKFKKINVKLLDYLISIITAIFIVIGVRLIGALLISAFIIFPSIISSNLTKGFLKLIICSIIVNIISVIIGIIFSIEFDLPGGSSIVVIQFILFLISIIYNKLRGD